MKARGSVPGSGRCSSGRAPPRRMCGRTLSASSASTGRKRSTCAFRAEGMRVLTAMMLRSWSSRTTKCVS
nr:MAG TPA_asm: hypothetical protein [Caudoviricetes sp.]